ncbi:MAG: 2-oxoglutarate ferredoxin oxidoreductase subunit beta [Oligoflexia bacterium]|nr:MAG: 2-oxoglutarate ferredoxin oxidoreductase subunit beta [Oligoflexia bacterium]
MSTPTNTETSPKTVPTYSRKDFLSSTEPRWCAGCGTFATFNGITRAFVNAGIEREKFAVVSGIGCSSRLPYYSNTYGFHTIHGRAPTVAMGLKMANPDLNVWVITGDGDGLSIGGNHFIHLMRRNPNIKVVLFNNQIYGLTKGQTSPTSPLGAKTKSAPYGSVDRPMHPLTVALGAGATFVARVPDTDNELMYQVLNAASKHEGVAIVEVLINCVIFNDKVFESITNKETRPDTTVLLEAGKPLLFGANKDRGIIMKNDRPTVAKIGEGGARLEDVIIHDPQNPNSGYAFMLAEMGDSELPVPYGIFRQIHEHVHKPHAGKGNKEGLLKTLRGSNTWSVDNSGKISSLEK